MLMITSLRGFIVLLVAISILWIPIIQQMQGGQLFIYIQVKDAWHHRDSSEHIHSFFTNKNNKSHCSIILMIYFQAISAYLSPPIAVVYCMAISWKRMNETGAFWGLMFGLAVGMFRMILDFTFVAPLCMEVDTRPFIVKSVSFLYFDMNFPLRWFCLKWGDALIKSNFGGYYYIGDLFDKSPAYSNKSRMSTFQGHLDAQVIFVSSSFKFMGPKSLSVSDFVMFLKCFYLFH